ncbi:MAG: DUF1080 domain-containing protein [Planctomycetes bacterium]|nr:DUF1080 domain-containing protein [Planctomycetota bacterium]
MCGVDFIRVKRADGSVVASAAAERPESGPEPRGNEYVAAGRDGRALNLDFETGNLDDWTAEGNAFDGQPIQGDAVVTRRGDMRSGHQGRYWIGGFEKVRDAGTGTLTSDVFPASHAYASFLMNGGNHENTRVEMIREDTGDVFFRIAGTNDETMRPVIVDLRAHLGKPIRIRLVDENRGGWGHINFDHFRMHDDRPAPLTPPMVALVPDEYPHSGLSAAEAAAAMDAPEGFSILVGASEPDVKQPIAMALDDRGRVWIAEAYEYPVRAKGDRGRDRILIFEDTDGDGTLDKRSIFTEGLNLVSGLEVGFGGVWVGAAPYLLFIPDADRDDKPDGDPQVLLDGWGYQDTHETANAFIWGPDGWLYGCHGVFTHSRVGRPGTPDEQRVPLNAAVWRYHPTRHAFEVFAHGTSNPWGVDFNDHGQAFVTACVIPHLFHIIQGARYQRQGGQHFNPYTYRDIVTIADHLHYLGATPHGGNSKSDGAGGGHAHAGAMIYLGDRWPASYRDQLFMNNIHGQRLNVDWLEPRGSGYVGRHGPDFLLTGDKASQILNLRYGPDGNAWMIDWYDMQACHRTEVEIHDRTNGRIYKVAYGNPKDAFQPIDASARTDLELAEWTLHANDWYVRHARRVLQERASSSSIAPEAIDRLASIATAHSDDTRRLRALWALHVTGRLTDAIAGRLLADASPYVRGWAVQLMLERFAAESPGAAPPAPFLDRLAAMSRDDESPIVRLYLASAAQRLPLDARWTILEGLARHAADAEDPNLPLMYWYAAEPLADVDTSRALAFAMSAGESIPLLREFMLRRIGSSDSGASLDVLAKGLETAETSELRLAFLQALRAALRGQRRAAPPERWAAVSERVLGDADERVRLHATVVGVAFGDSAALEAMRTRAAERSTPLDTRLAALQALLDAGDAGSVPLLRAMLDEPGPIQESAIRGLAQFDDPAVSADLLNVYATLSQQAKRLALGTLCARTNSALALLGAIRDKRVPGTDLTADLVRGLQLLKNDQVDALLTEAWGTVRESEADRKAMIVELTRLVESPDHPAADPALGRAVFAKTCMKCHALFGVGETIGPDLTGSNRANLDYLLSNIVDPSAVMAREYRPTIVVTTDGRVVTGLIQAEDERSVTLRTGDGVVVVPKAEVDTRSESEKSMMPDDQLRPFTEHEVRSLVSYVRGPRQSPILATAENRGALFNGRDLTGWSGTDGLWSVENGEIVGRTEGLARNEWLVSDLAVDDFRLTLDVKLVDNAGNSGVQFRSRANDGEVAGYQADIGAGWWGKLYEEHGRALLWDKSGEAHIRPGEWTTYEITARGHHIQTFLNGAPGVDLEDPTGATRGVIAFQLHSGGKTEVRFRNLRLEVLESK